MDKYRLIEQKDEIFMMVQKAPVIHIGEVWQTLPTKREVYNINRIEVLSEALVFQTTLSYEFDKDFPIFIRINYKNLIFKLMPGEFKSFKNQLSCIYPKEARALELRNIERVKLPKNCYLSVTLRTLSSDSASDVKVNLENVSEKGLGIRSVNLDTEFFQRNKVFKITKLCGRELHEEATLSVRHLSEKENKVIIGVGLSADVAFSERFFEILREEIKRERYARPFP